MKQEISTCDHCATTINSGYFDTNPDPRVRWTHLLGCVSDPETGDYFQVDCHLCPAYWTLSEEEPSILRNAIATSSRAAREVQRTYHKKREEFRAVHPELFPDG